MTLEVFLNGYLMSMYMRMLACTYMYHVHHACVWCAQRPEEGDTSPGTGVTGNLS